MKNIAIRLFAACTVICAALILIVTAGCGTTGTTTWTYDENGKITSKTFSEKDIIDKVTESTKDKIIYSWKKGWAGKIDVTVATAEKPTPGFTGYIGNLDFGYFSMPKDFGNTTNFQYLPDVIKACNASALSVTAEGISGSTGSGSSSATSSGSSSSASDNTAVSQQVTAKTASTETVSTGLTRVSVTTDTNAVKGNLYDINANANTVTLTLPASPAEGDQIGYSVTDATNTVTLAPNGQKIGDSSENITLAAGAAATLTYTNGAWVSVATETK